MLAAEFDVNFNDTTLVYEQLVKFLHLYTSKQIPALTNNQDGTIVFELMFQKTNDCINEILVLDGSITAVIAYDKDAIAHPVSWKPSTINAVDSKDNWIVAPNPTKDGVIKVQMNLKEHKNIVFRLMDNTGRIVFTKQEEAVKGNNNFTLKEGLIPGGTYYLQAIGVEGVKQLRVEN